MLNFGEAADFFGFHVYAGGEEICNLCIKDYMKKHKVSLFTAVKMLNGKFYTKKMLKINDSTYVCEDCLRKAMEIIDPKDPVVEAIDSIPDDEITSETETAAPAEEDKKQHKGRKSSKNNG